MSLRLLKTGTPQILAFLAILLADRLVSPQFFDIRLQAGRLFAVWSMLRSRRAGGAVVARHGAGDATVASICRSAP